MSQLGMKNQNSEYGLYITNRIFRKGSCFVILNNNASLLFVKYEKTNVECQYKGTALRLRINTRNLISYSEMLATFRKVGGSKSERT